MFIKLANVDDSVVNLLYQPIMSVIFYKPIFIYQSD